MGNMIRRSPAASITSLCVSLLLLVSATNVAAENVQTDPIVVEQLGHVLTPVPLREMAPLPWPNRDKVIPLRHLAARPRVYSGPDPVLQDLVLPKVSTINFLNFDGVNDAQGGFFVPPDTNASVGGTQVVETVNVAYAVYDKTTGALEFGPVNIRTLYAPLGGQCANGNLSDPIVNYDKEASRWVITMIAYNNSFSQNNSCIAVSNSNDAAGTYHLYSFNYGHVLPDYPKVGVWPDAYYLTSNNFAGGGPFIGAETCALDRTAMLAGNKAKQICFQRGVNDFSLLPSDLDGTVPPPSGAPNYELELDTASFNKLDLFKFHVDFIDPSHSTFTGPTPLTVASYIMACDGGICIPQPSPGEALDSLGDRLMYRLPYRNFGDHESLLANHSVAPTKGDAFSAVRWYEIRNPGFGPKVYQSGTFATSSDVSLWMASLAMDKVGDIALGFSESSPDLDPSIAYTGRVPSDPLGTMESPFLVKRGTGVQEISFNRWGDYSSMAIDPSDDCTFWYAQEYYKTTGSFNFRTRLNSFKFRRCQ